MLMILSHQETFISAENDSSHLINFTKISLELQIFEGQNPVYPVPHCQPKTLMMPDIKIGNQTVAEKRT